MHWIQQYHVDGHLSECYVSGVKGGEDTLEGTEVGLRSGKWRKRTDNAGEKSGLLDRKKIGQWLQGEKEMRTD